MCEGVHSLIDNLWREIERLRTAVADKDKVLMPRSLTAENGAKALLVGEFFETRIASCSECDDEDEETTITISWTNIKAIYKKAVEELGEKNEN